MMSNIIISVFETNVKKLRDKTAVIDSKTGVNLTYGELDILAGRIASKLQHLGIEKGSSVAIVLPQNTDYVASMLAVMKLGAAFAPLNYYYPQERINYILNDCQARVVINDEFMDDVADYPPFTEKVSLSEDDAAILVYTSGSTGNPKGVRIDNGAIFASVQRFVNMADPSEDDIYAIGAPFFFVVGVELICIALNCGMTAVLVSLDAMRDPYELSDLVARNNVTIAFMSPKIMKYFKSKNSDLRMVICGGERMSGIYSDDFITVNGYGSSESVGGSLFFILDKEYDNTPIGKVTGEGLAYILDDMGNEAEEGELCLAGRFADSYINLPEESSKVFIPNPFCERDGYPFMVRTNDIVRRLEDGNILYLNRKDWMLKINGQRVEPGEIEAVIRKLPGVTDAVVKDCTDSRNNSSLVAYYVSKERNTVEELKKFLGKYLPAYMIPAFYVHMEKLPLNANGKLDRKALPDPVLPDRQIPYEAPSNEAELKLCTAFEKVIGIEAGGVGRNDDFFAIGGDSIRAIEVMDIADLEGLSARLIFQNKTAAGIAKALRDRSAEDIEEYEKKARTMRIPITPAQELMIADLSGCMDSMMYNLSRLYRINAELDAEKLANAVDTAVAQHPGLCSVFDHDRDGKIIQYIRPGFPGRTKVEEVSEENFQKISQTLMQPFEIYNAPLFRSRVFHCKDKLYLFIEMLHLVSDGTSLDVFYKDISRAYWGKELSRDHFYSYIRKESEIRMTDAFENARQYFSNLLGDRDWCRLPVSDFETEDISCGRLCVKKIMTVDEILLAEKRTGCSRNVLSITAAMQTLREYCSKDKISVDYINNNRMEKHLMDTVGLLYKTLPIAADLSLYPTNASLLHEVNRQVIESFVNSVADYTAKLDLIKEDAIAINYVSDLGSEENFEGFEAENISLFDENAIEMGGHADLYIQEQAGYINVQLDYLKNAYKKENMQRFLDLFIKNLKQLSSALENK